MSRFSTEDPDADIVINSHLLIEEHGKLMWQCIKDDCGFVIRPGWRGHRCMFRPEMYTEKPVMPSVLPPSLPSTKKPIT